MTTPNDSELPAAPPAADIEPADAPVVPPVPTSVVVSYWILLVSAAINVLIVVITLATWNKVVNQLLTQPRPAGTTLAQAQSAIHSYLIANLILDVAFAALYVLFAILMRRGRNWARLTITAIVVVFALLGILNGSDLFTLISVLLELVAVGLLYTKPAKAYFAATRAASRFRR
ncbi:MAG TPA: hypothetical protein VH333_26500 [Pseudonocardiaceae bacterium]|nr:hypothetical protein [Pseudonocardiaceae bacterium]